MSADPAVADPVELARLQESLLQCRRELAVVRSRYEEMAETRAEADRARSQLIELARSLDARLTRDEGRGGGLRGWVKRRLRKSAATAEEAAATKRLRKSRQFDGVWYLSTYPEVAATGLSPALHYLRHGAAEGKDPGPDFSTRQYVARHPQLARTKVNPLLNHLKTGQ